METIAARIAAIHDRIAAAARRAGRPPAEVRLIGVSKTHPPELVAEALAVGLHDFGENRVQEAESKIAALAADRARISWHLIGHLQTNKARRVAALFDCVHSVDSVHLARALDRYAAEQADTQTHGQAGGQHNASLDLLGAQPGRLPILVQVNVSGEASKEGFDLAGWEHDQARLDAFLAEVEQLLALPRLAVSGLMTIAPWGSDPEQARPTFRSARRLRDELARHFGGGGAALSMGMTDDFEVAIEEGATLVRVGRAIFGEREQR